MSGDKEYLYGEFEFLSATDESCPVCGHATGNCAPPDQPHVRVIGTDTFASLKTEEMFVIKEDIFEERQISQFTKSKVLVYAKGKAIPVSEAKKLGLI
jgi:hypothetical protein